ncbi:MAG TPA: dihydroorotate dehydrogenase, partial [Gammaproteobacteria bacterium]|nr:dihydroorotate dehydrogenase [Gammaproteobacteria bacterium]
PKLTPNVPNVGEIAAAAAEGGADALCAINTVGPAFYTSQGHPVLTNTLGGMSGKGVLPIALKCVREIRAAVDLPVIGCGGISNADD